MLNNLTEFPLRNIFDQDFQHKKMSGKTGHYID